MTALLQGHVEIHRIPLVGFIERLEGDAAGAETKRAGIARDGLADVAGVECHGTPVGPGAGLFGRISKKLLTKWARKGGQFT